MFSFFPPSPPLQKFIAPTRQTLCHENTFLKPLLSPSLPGPLVPPDFIWVSLQAKLSPALFKKERGGGMKRRCASTSS